MTIVQITLCVFLGYLIGELYELKSREIKEAERKQALTRLMKALEELENDLFENRR